MLRIDAHHHLWKFDQAEYGWIDESMTVLRRDFLAADLHEEMTAAGIGAAIAVQARQSIEETQWLLEVANRNDFIKAVVGWGPLIDANVGDVLDQLTAAQPKLRAFRHVLQDEPNPDYMLREDFNRGIRELTRRNLTYDILIFERHLPQAIQFVDRHPHQRFVLDHLAKPRVKDNALSLWSEHIHELAKRPNVTCKVSGLATEADHKNWTELQLTRYLDEVISAFGPKRVMFGSDWPVCLLAIDYQDWVEIVARVLGPDAEQLWSKTAIEAYNLTIAKTDSL